MQIKVQKAKNIICIILRSLALPIHVYRWTGWQKNFTPAGSSTLVNKQSGPLAVLNNFFVLSSASWRYNTLLYRTVQW